MKQMRLRFQTLLVPAMLPAAFVVFPSLSFGAKAPATLSFNVAAQVKVKANGQNELMQTTNGRVFLRGGQVRIESKVGDQNVVMLLLKPYIYRLLPAAKAGVRYKSSTPSPELEAFFSDWPSLMNQPAKIRAALQKKGAKKTGTAKLSGVTTDVYAASRWDGQPRNMKFWLRRADGLPMRLESSAGGAKVTINWSNYRRGLALSPSLFAVPSGYKIREGQPPQMMG